MAQKEVREYLKSGTEKGFSLKELKKELVKAGHEVKVIEEATKEFERKNTFKIISVFGIVIVVSLAVIFGFKDLIFDSDKVVGTNLNNIEKNNINIDTNYDVNQCNIGDNGYGLCCVRNNKLVDCSNEGFLSKNEFIIFRINLKDLIKDKINEKFYKECTYSYIREKKEDKVERKEYCAVNLESDKDFFINLKGFISDEDLININILDSYNELSTNNAENPTKLFNLFNLRVNTK